MCHKWSFSAEGKAFCFMIQLTELSANKVMKTFPKMEVL